MSLPAKRFRPPTTNLLTAFRGEVRPSAPLHPQEKALVAVVSAHLCFLPWALGTRAPWAQVLSLGFALVAFTLALWPRHYTGELAPQGDFKLQTWPRLLRFPPFWLGLGFILYITISALNPAWRRVSVDVIWYIENIPYIEWLPSSVSAPFARMNAWRILVIVGTVWLLACALWTAITRRGAIQTILSTVVVNGVVLSLIAILQKVTYADKVLWFIPAPAAYFHGTFFYKNHAGAYFVLITVVSVALMAWHHIRSLRRLERSSPAPVFAFSTIVLGVCVFMSASRTAMLLLIVYFITLALVYVFWRGKERMGGSNKWVSLVIGACGIGFVSVAAYFLNLDQSIEQFRRLTSEDRHLSVEARILSRNATFELFKDQPLTGWGAGSFRHAFPIYQQNYPAIFRGEGRRVFYWDHAHNDYVQALAEFGVIGMLFPVCVLLWMLIKLIRLGAPSHPPFLFLALGLGLTLAHAWVDFPLYNACILTSFGAVWVLLVRWAELETR